FFYMDPPYWQTEGYGVPFPFQEYVDMAELMRTIKGKAMISINDHPDIRKAFEGLPMMELDITYTLAKGAPSDKSGELVITNWDAGGLGGLFDGV
ncbi:MAG: DNA methyltransferase, partial [Gammaproteobacteria bacterium HGW-Gammaproteobacteria-6]